MCAFIGSGLGVDVNKPATWNATYLLQIASETQLRQFLKKVRALPQVSRRDDTTGLVIVRGIAVDDLVDLSLNFIFDRAKEIQSRLCASFNFFYSIGDGRLSWRRFSSLLEFLGAGPPLCYEQAVNLFREIQGDVPIYLHEMNDKDEGMAGHPFVDSMRFARGAWKSCVFQHVTRPPKNTPCEASLSPCEGGGLKVQHTVCENPAQLHIQSITVHQKIENHNVDAPSCTIIGDTIKIQGSAKCTGMSRAHWQNNVRAFKGDSFFRNSSRGAVIARLKQKQLMAPVQLHTNIGSYLQNEIARKVY